GGGGDRLGQGDVERRELDRNRRPGGARLERRVEPAVAEHRGMNAARELAQLLQGVGELLARGADDLRGPRGIGVDPREREPERQGERDEALLSAVVQVPLEPSPRLVGGDDDARTRRTELLLLALAL